jgi:hypothetical protein
MLNPKMKITFPILTAMLVLASCSGLKTVSQAGNYDDAYFTASDLKGRGYYAEGVSVSTYNQPSAQRAGSYGQTYSERLRHFGDGRMQPVHRPAMMTQSCRGFRYGFAPMTPWGFNPYMGYNPMMMGNTWGNPWMMGNSWNNPYMMGNMSWNMYNDPYWMYYNQMYNPNMYWGGGWSGNGWNNNGWNNHSGWNNGWNNNSGWSNNSTPINNRPSGGGFVNNPKPASGSSGFTNSGVRRNSYQSGTPSSTSGRSSSWSSGSTSSGSSNSSSSGSSRSSSWTPSGNTQQGSFNSGSSRSSNAVQGTSGRRR